MGSDVQIFALLDRLYEPKCYTGCFRKKGTLLICSEKFQGDSTAFFFSGLLNNMLGFMFRLKFARFELKRGQYSESLK